MSVELNNGSSSSTVSTDPALIAQQQQAVIASLQLENAKLHSLGSSIQHQLKVAQDKLAIASAHRPRIPSPAHFTGETGSAADEWIDSLEKQFAYYGSSLQHDEERIKYAVMFFAPGKATTWWNSSSKELTTAGTPITTWSEFTSAVRERYQPISSAMIARQSLDTFVQRGSVQNYTDHFYQCMNFITDMGMTDQIHRYTSGLRQEIKSKVIEAKVTSIHDAVNEAHSAESYLGMSRGTSSGSFKGSRFPQRAWNSAGASTGTSSAMDINMIGSSQAGEEDTSTARERHLQQQIDALMSQQQLQSSINAMFERTKSPSSFGGGRGGYNSGGSGSGAGGPRVSDVTKEEFARCRAEHRCLQCHEVGHVANGCKKPRNLKW